MGQSNIDAVHLDRLRDHYAKHGALPSYAGIGELLGFKTKTAAVKLANRLVAAGFLKSAPGGKVVPASRFFELPLFDAPVRAGLAESLDGQLAADVFSIEGFLVESPSTTVLIRVKGESMKDAGIFDGDLAVVDRQRSAMPGAFVVAIVDGGFTLKELRFENKSPILIPHNSDYMPIKPVGTLEVFGVVRGIVRKFKGSPVSGTQFSKVSGGRP
jgi:SOS-response transcriptional repressor LexA